LNNNHYHSQEFWKLFERYDYAATHAPSLFHEGLQTSEGISRSMVQYNDAVIGFRWNARTREARCAFFLFLGFVVVFVVVVVVVVVGSAVYYRGTCCCRCCC
jgi:hypothetical protein